MYDTKYYKCLVIAKKMCRMDFQREFDLSQPHAHRIMKNLSKLEEVEEYGEIIIRGNKKYLVNVIKYVG